MKNVAVLTCAAFALSGCLAGPTSTEQVRKMTSGSSLFAKQTSVTVPKSHSFVTARLSEGANKCMNRTVRSTSTTPGPYGPQTMTIVTDYDATLKRTATGTELALYQEVRGRILPQPKGISYVVDAAPVSGGTQLVFHGGRFGYGALNEAVEQWARGGGIVCPDLPGSA